MKKKVEFLDKQLRKDYYSILSVISLIFSFVFIVVEIPDNKKLIAGVILIILLILSYIILWIKANLSESAKIKINNSVIEVRVGDIFKENELKVIPFNEYFDTQVDNKIISEKTLNGMYVNQIFKDVNKLNNLMDGDERLKDNFLECNNKRFSGKKNKYKLGSIFEHENYLLTAFSKFDEDNRAYLGVSDYINFLLNFWNEVDIVYAGRSISIPLLGSGITRFKGYDMISEQELLELLIWSFKVSRIKFKYPSQVSIIIHESTKDKINFYKLKEC